jgi:hypothetical protein
LNTSVGRAEFVRQLYNLSHVLERDKEAGDTEAKIQRLQNKIDQHNKKYPMKSFDTEDTDCAAREVKQEVIVDNDGSIWEPVMRAR